MKLESSKYCFPCYSAMPELFKPCLQKEDQLPAFVGSGKELKLSKSDRDTLLQVKEFIEGREVDEPISLKALCRKFALNEFKLKNGFRQLFRVSPYDYFLELKMTAAKKLLLEADTTVYGVAYTLGYQHVSNFCAQFKKRFGITPKDFRSDV
jgi:AraC-like DNA-binding protein